MPRLLPIGSSANLRIITQLDDMPAEVDLRWDGGSGYWYLDLTLGEPPRPLLRGRRVIPGWRLAPPLDADGNGWQLAAVPLTDNAPEVIGRHGWGTTHGLYYFTDADGVDWQR